ncbi:VanW family protein [Candidatus Peregrinibacteria bacterium]|nr:VanW family protein [Candidatus Peregrinibacteria bacterium]
MKTNILHHLLFFGASFITVVGMFTWGEHLKNIAPTKHVVIHSAAPTQLTELAIQQPLIRTTPITPLARQALALQKRLRESQGYSPPLFVLTPALTDRQELLTHATVVSFTHPDTGEEVGTWDTSIQKYPTWLTLSTGIASASFAVNPKRIVEYFARNGYPELISPPIHTIVQSTVTNKRGVTHAETTAIARAGFTFNVSEVSSQIAQAIQSGTPTLTIPLKHDNGRVYFASSSGIVVMDLLGVGQSNFARSDAGRDFNIRRALKSYLHNIIIPPGETFSFNRALDNAVTLNQGWKEALGIFDGWDLRPTPGGGICQTSTTFYRALLAAGLPIIEQYNHSLYVHYYEKYGVGLDATIFMGDKDLVFRNDTPSYMLVQAYADGYDAFINLYGVRDGRSVDLLGPYFATNAPEDLTVFNRKLHVNEIAWVQRIHRPNGETKENILVSRYKEIPIRLLAEHKKQKEETVEL